jgi:hypothetical protein
MVRSRRPHDAAHGGASAPHAFVEPEDPRSGLAAGAVQGGLQMASPLAVAGASLRVARCALGGCGKPRQDPIHREIE